MWHGYTHVYIVFHPCLSNLGKKWLQNDMLHSLEDELYAFNRKIEGHYQQGHAANRECRKFPVSPPLWCQDYSYSQNQFCPFGKTILEKVTVEWLFPPTGMATPVSRMATPRDCRIAAPRDCRMAALCDCRMATARDCGMATPRDC